MIWIRIVLGLSAFAALPQAADVPDLGTRKAGVDWPGFLGPTRDGKSPEKGPVAAWPPRVVWHREIGESFGAASVARGRLFFFDRASDKFRLSCLRSETGEPLWKVEEPTEWRDLYGSGDGPRCGPVVDDDRVYLFAPDGMLSCVRAADGAPVWRKNTAEEYKVVPNFFGVGSTPLVEGELLIVHVGGSPADSPGIASGRTRGLDSGIVAFDKRTGKEKYRITDELASYSSPMTTTIEGRRWGFVFARGGLVGFEPATGKVDFRFPWRARINESVNICNPVVSGDLVFVSEAYGPGSAVLKVRPGGFDVAWKDGRGNAAMACYFSTPIAVDGLLYGSSGQGTSNAELRCVEMATGKVRWSVPDLTRCSLLLVDGRFVCLGEDGALRLVKVNPDKYEELGKASLAAADGTPLLKSPAWAAPVLSHGLLYVRGRDRLVCLDLIPSPR